VYRGALNTLFVIVIVIELLWHAEESASASKQHLVLCFSIRLFSSVLLLCMTMMLMMLSVIVEYSLVCFAFHVSIAVRWCQGHCVFMLSIYPFISICPLVCLCVHLSAIFPQYLWCALMDFHQTFVSSASWEKMNYLCFEIKRSKVRVTA